MVCVGNQCCCTNPSGTVPSHPFVASAVPSEDRIYHTIQQYLLCVTETSAGDVSYGPKTDSCAAASRPIRSPGRLAAIWRWASFECRRLGFRGTTRCGWDNSPRPGAGEKLSLLPAKGSRGWSMSDLGRAQRSTLLDAFWRTAYRVGFPLARIWWRLRHQQHEGGLVAVYVGQALLLVRSSYRIEWKFPGGTVRQGETPEVAARRELAEEIGLAGAFPLVAVGDAWGLWDGRKDKVYFFELRLDRLPELKLDNREIIGARRISPS